MRPTEDNLPYRLVRHSRAWLLKHVILPAGDFAAGHEMTHRLRFLEEAQWWEPARLHAHRDQLVASVIQTAYAEVPLYRELMDRAKLGPTDVKKAADLRKLPVVTKSMLRAGYPHRTCRKTGACTYEASTSGSTGTNFRVREDNQTAAWYRASFMLALEWAGWTVGERHLQTGMNLQRSLDRRLKDLLLACHYVSAFDLSDAHLDQNLELLDRHRIRHLWGYPGSLYYLARRALDKGWNRPLTSVVTWGDNLFPLYRRTMEAAFKTRVFDTYGCGEGIQVSAQCGHGHAYHVHVLDVVVDFLDDAGHPVTPGQPGNIVLTRLHSGPMPLIRYKVGDIGIDGVAEPCPCGRGFDRMKGIQGRNTDVVITPAGNRLIVHFFTGILEHFPEVDSFQVVQETPETLVVRVVPTPCFSPESCGKIVAALCEKGIAGMQIEIELVNEIPLTPGGKRRFVINKVSGLQPQTVS